MEHESDKWLSTADHPLPKDGSYMLLAPSWVIVHWNGQEWKKVVTSVDEFTGDDFANTAKSWRPL